MERDVGRLRLALVVGALYFLGVAVAHFTSFKVPGLYVYFNVPSHAYQDRIIGALALGWAILLFTAYGNPLRNLALVRGLVTAGACAVIALAAINATTDFEALAPTADVRIFWAEWAALLFYLLWLTAAYRGVVKTAHF